MIKIALSYVITETIVQIMLWSMIPWYYDLSTEIYIVSGVIILLAISIDFLICRRTSNASTYMLHFSDLLLAIPSAIVGFHHIFSFPNIQTTPLMLFIFLSNSLILFERFILIERQPT